MSADLTLPASSFWLRPNPKYSGQSPIAALFSRLTAKFGDDWTHQFVGASAEESARLRENWEREWADAFVKAKLSPAHVNMALYGWNRLGKVPNLGEFLAAAVPVPDPEVAFQEAAENMRRMKYGHPYQWSHPALYWAAMEVGPDDMRGLTWSVIKARWTRNLYAQLRRLQWPPVPRFEPTAATYRRPGPSRVGEVLRVIDQASEGRASDAVRATSRRRVVGQ